MFNCQFGVATGQVIAPSIGQTRTEADFWLIFSRLLLTQQVLDLHYRSIEYSSIGILGAVGHFVCGLNQDLGLKVNSFLNQWQPGWNF